MIVIGKEDDNLNIETARKSRILLLYCSSPLPSLRLPSRGQEGPLPLRLVLRWHQKLPSSLTRGDCIVVSVLAQGTSPCPGVASLN